MSEVKDKYALALMDMAVRFGQTSTATRLKVGSIIYKNGSIISLGCNGQPPGWHTEVCEDETGKTMPTVRHAEAAALEKLYLSTETSEGAEMFISHAPCLSCSLKIVAAKIGKVYYRHDYRCSEGVEYLKENGVVVQQLKEDCEGYNLKALDNNQLHKLSFACYVEQNERLEKEKESE